MKLQTGQKIFCSYAFTGEAEALVRARMQLVVATFDALGLSAYCNLDDAATHAFTSPEQYIYAGLRAMRQCDVVFCLQTSERRSEGQLIEIGAALEREMPIVLAQHQSAVGKTYIDTLALTKFTWTNNASLQKAIATLV